MVNKYYTPEIEEFHIGFEFETAIIDCNWVNHGWENRIFDLDFDIKLVRDYPDLNRVKYLDENDLIELGFYESTEESDAWETNEDNILLLDYFKEGKGWYITYSENESQFGFGGWIKNKSELKKLMQQLNLK